MTDRLPGYTAIFAANELERLESWLIAVESGAPAGHFDLLSAIYGPAWLEPYAGILDSPGTPFSDRSDRTQRPQGPPPVA
jgi:hypothetical protein